MKRRDLLILAVALFVGIVGMKLATWATDLYYDHQFLHAVRVNTERAAAAQGGGS